MSRVCLSSRFKIFTNKVGSCSISTIDRAITRGLTSCTVRVGSWRYPLNYHPKLDNIRKNSTIQSNAINPIETFFDTNNNIFKSHIADIDNVSGVYLHEYIWKNVDKWWNNTAIVIINKKK